MNAYTPRDGIDCFIVVPPQYRPQIYTGVSFLNGNNLRAHVTITERKNENRIPLSSGRMDIFQLGKPRKDLSLKIVGSNPETERVIEEIVNRNIPVYIYPRSGGNLQLNVPLIRGLGTDPIDDATATFTLTTAAGTTVYMPRGDSGHGVYLEEIDATAPLLDGTWTTNGTQGQLPTGRGMPFMRPFENLLKMSLMTTIVYEAPYSAGNEWGAYTSAADVWGTDHGTRQSIWCADAMSYWTTSTTTTLRSYDFNTSGGTTIHQSFCYRVDGTMQVVLKDSGGTSRWAKNVTTGSGRIQFPTTGIASYSGAYFEVTLTSGSYAGISCWQFVDGNSIDFTEALPFLGTSTAVEGEITANSLIVACDMGADSVPFTATVADRDGAVLASGYVQPMFSDAYALQGSVIAELTGYDHRCSGYIGENGAGGLIFGLQTDGTSRDTATITGHQLGDIYAWGLYSGYADGTHATRFYCVRLRDDATYTSNYAESVMFPYQLSIGCNTSGAQQADSILAAVTVEANAWGNCRDAVDRLADCAVLNVIRNTTGRWFTLDRAISPKRYKADANSGTLTATEVRAI